MGEGEGEGEYGGGRGGGRLCEEGEGEGQGEGEGEGEYGGGRGGRTGRGEGERSLKKFSSGKCLATSERVKFNMDQSNNCKNQKPSVTQCVQNVYIANHRQIVTSLPSVLSLAESSCPFYT